MDVDSPDPIDNGFVVQFLYPDAKVIMRRVNKYPVMLTVFKVEDGEETEIYSGEQRGFFRKNLHRDVPKLKKALEQAGPVSA